MIYKCFTPILNIKGNKTTKTLQKIPLHKTINLTPQFTWNRLVVYVKLNTLRKPIGCCKQMVLFI